MSIYEIYTHNEPNACPKCCAPIKLRVSRTRGAWAVCSYCKEEFDICGPEAIRLSDRGPSQTIINRVIGKWNKQTTTNAHRRKPNGQPCSVCGSMMTMEANRRDGVVRAICTSCPDHKGDYIIARGNELQWDKLGHLTAPCRKEVLLRWKRLADARSSKAISCSDAATRYEYIVLLMRQCMEIHKVNLTEEQIDTLASEYAHSYIDITYEKVADFVLHSRVMA